MTKVTVVHRMIVALLTDYPQHRFTASDLRIALASEYAALPCGQLPRYLADLERWNVIRRVEAEAGYVFYDFNRDFRKRGNL